MYSILNDPIVLLCVLLTMFKANDDNLVEHGKG